ncbi:unnamed protein product [Fraxinus pennsylvanica]|uniref:Uncharacterized protein n=1 Tax=Fraxinus pennsylvanica TaxID=56036 RepID=A0AAD2DJQ2_9LAMI|nr:unnamed protein product [Fraxinus pennsylvanica]
MASEDNTSLRVASFSCYLDSTAKENLVQISAKDTKKLPFSQDSLASLRVDSFSYLNTAGENFVFAVPVPVQDPAPAFSFPQETPYPISFERTKSKDGEIGVFDMKLDYKGPCFDKKSVHVNEIVMPGTICESKPTRTRSKRVDHFAVQVPNSRAKNLTAEEEELKEKTPDKPGRSLEVFGSCSSSIYKEPGEKALHARRSCNEEEIEDHCLRLCTDRRWWWFSVPNRQWWLRVCAPSPPAVMKKGSERSVIRCCGGFCLRCAVPFLAAPCVVVGRRCVLFFFFCGVRTTGWWWSAVGVDDGGGTVGSGVGWGRELGGSTGHEIQHRRYSPMAMKGYRGSVAQREAMEVVAAQYR